MAEAYKNPLSWWQLIEFIILKFIIVFLYRYVSEYFVWVLIYVSTFISVLYALYLAAVFEYNEKNLDKLSYDLENPWFLLYAFLLVPFFYFILYLSEIPMTPETKLFIIFFWEVITWLTFLFILLIDIFHYVFHIEILTAIYKFLNNISDKAVTTTAAVKTDLSGVATDLSLNRFVKTQEPLKEKEEVFNISENKFTYNDAQAVCKAYGAKLADYDQVEQAYHDGAEWLNYGWSEGQFAYFPLQKETWKKLNKNDPEGKTSIGKVRPGISGGYFANKDLKFGANCFGKKPSKRPQDLQLNITESIVAKTAQDAQVDSKVEYYKKNADKTKIASFNEKKWSGY